VSRRGRYDYVAFEREQIPASALVAEWRTGQIPSAWVSVPHVNVFRQTRGEGAADDLHDLIRSLRSGDKISIIQPPTVGLFTLGAAKRYVRDLNSCWGTEQTYAGCNLLPGAHEYRMAAIIAGHRRTLASYVLAQEISGEQTPDLWIPVQHQIDPSFYEGLQTQYQENSHKAVPLWQEADSIAATVRWGRRTGQLGSYTDVADYLGVTAERVSNAVSYDALPKLVKDRVRHGSLTQENAILLERIGSALAVRMLNSILGPDQIEDMKQRLRKRQLRVDELRPYMEECGLMNDWEGDLHAELTRMLAKERMSVYVSSRINELVGDGVLFGMGNPTDPRDNDVTILLLERRRMQAEAIRSLRLLLSALESDRHRLQFVVENPDRQSDSSLLSTPIIANSPNSRRTWQSVVDTMQVITSKESTDSEILGALDAVTGCMMLLSSEAQLELRLGDRSSEFIQAMEVLRDIIRGEGASLAGIGAELDMSLAVLQRLLRSNVVQQPGGMF